MTIVADKMFLVLDSIANDDRDVVSLARLTQHTNLPKATLYRLLCDLAGAGVVDHGTGGYSLGTRLFELGNAVPRYRRLRAAATPHLESLHQRTGETVHLATLQGTQLLVLDKLHATHTVRIPTRVGMRLPLHSTALGKVALAHGPSRLLESVLGTSLRPLTQRTLRAPGLLERQVARCGEEGVAVETEETILGVGCLAAPVLDVDGTLIGAVSLAGSPHTRRSPQLSAHLRKAVRAIADEVALQAA